MRHPSWLFIRNCQNLFAGALIFIAPALAQQYTAKILNPAGSVAAVLNGTAGGQQVGADSNGHAMLLMGDAATAVDLHPGPLYLRSVAASTDGAEQCGYTFDFNGNFQAIKWSGSGVSAALLPGAACLGSHSGQQVGFAQVPYSCCTAQAPASIQTYAYLWSGGVTTNLTAVYSWARALAVRNGQQVGYGWNPALNLGYPYDTDSYDNGRALLWNGTAASVGLLHPMGYASSQALATNGSEQAGWATDGVTLSRHAILWSGTALITKPSLFPIIPANGGPSMFWGANPSVWLTSGTPGIAVDLHPAGFFDSRVNAMNASQQAGDGWVGAPGTAGSIRHALVWSGIAGSAVDLNPFLPVGYLHAIATGIDAAGNIVGYAYNTPPVSTAVSYRITAMPADAVAVLFTPSPVAAVTVASVLLSPANPAPGSIVQGTVNLSGPAPANGVTLTFQTSDPALLAAPFAVSVAAGQSAAAFAITAGGANLTVPTIAKIMATDGAVSRSGGVVITPAVNVATVSAAPIEGGLFTTGTVTLKIPAQFGGASLTVTFGNPSLAGLVDSVMVPAGATTASFRISTMPVTVPTSVPITASLNGQTVSGAFTLNPPPPISITALSLPTTIVGGQQATGTVTVNNYPRNAAGAVITLTSGDTKTLQVPATVTIPQGAFSANFTVTTVVVTGSKGVSVKATYGTSNLSATVTVAPIPAIAIVQADYLTDTQTLKVAATTTATNPSLSFGVDPLGPALGTLVFELGQYRATSTALPTAPATISVWSADGGLATLAVTQKLSTGGGGGGTASTFKLTVSKNGKGAVVSNPAGIACGAPGGTCSLSFTAATGVTLTASPDAGISFTGWGGACSGTLPSCTVGMNTDKSVTATFK